MSFFTIIHVLYSKMCYDNFSHTQNHLHRTFQSVINISHINNTLSTGQLTAIQFVMQ